MNRGELDCAKRKAYRLLDEWIEVTGALSGDYDGLKRVVERAVECGGRTDEHLHLLGGALLLLREAGIKVGSAELIAAADRASGGGE